MVKITIVARRAVPDAMITGVQNLPFGLFMPHANIAERSTE
ncbi:hypothetical protein [Mycobacterium sp. E2327]|nr:hypothetical protein [Mycobacterium sp. E2327]